jgi:hypothetical protein
MQSRRAFVCQAVLASAAAPPRAGRKRRILWNNDGDDLRNPAFGLPRLWTARGPQDVPIPDPLASPDQFLSLRMPDPAAAGVDSIFYCGHFNWSVWEFPPERLARLGPEPLKLVIDHAHRFGAEFFFSIRLNDVHSSWEALGPSSWEPFRLRNPHLLQANVPAEEFEKRFLPFARGETKVHPLADVLKRRGGASRDYQSWSAFDYAHAEVRAYFLSVVEEACRRYDVDGIELDFLRHPFFFRFGQERRCIPLMNEFMRRVRDALTARGRQRGRPILLAVRVPDSVPQALAVGLDPESWLAEGLIDLVVAGNGKAPFSAPFAEWVELAHRKSVPVYACFCRTEQILRRPEAVRGAASRAWKQGVDGIYFFNHYIPAEHHTMRVAREAAQVTRATCLYRIDPDYSGSQNGTITPGQLPLVFGAGANRAELVLDIPGDPQPGARVSMYTQWSGRAVSGRVAWTVNGAGAGKPSEEHLEEKNWLAYSVPSLRGGRNALEVRVGAGPALALEQVRVTVEYA